MSFAEKVKLVDTTGNKVVTVTTQGSANSLAVYQVDSDGNIIERFDDSEYSIITTDNTDGNIEFVGWTLPENQSLTDQAVWKIAKLTYTAGGNPILRYADSVNTFNKIWNLKGNYVY